MGEEEEVLNRGDSLGESGDCMAGNAPCKVQVSVKQKNRYKSRYRKRSSQCH